MPIIPHSNESETQWGHGEFQVMIKSPRVRNPIGYCDGTEADERALRERAMKEGTRIRIDKKTLKTGRQIWTVHSLD